MIERIKKRVRLAAPLLALYWLGLFTLTHLPALPFSLALPGQWDKVVHAVAFLGLGLLLAFVVGGFIRLGVLSYLLLLCVAAAYGAVDEWAQQFFRRTTSLYDWLADVGGALAGLVVHALASEKPAAAADQELAA